MENSVDPAHLQILHQDAGSNLESRAIPQVLEPGLAISQASPLPRVTVQSDLRAYQQLLWEAGR